MSVVAPTAPDLAALLDEVWSSLVGAPDELALGGPLPDCSTLWSATVTITGEWRAMVSLDLGDPVVLAVTRAMLGFAEDEVPDVASCTDAIGELANIVGGNVKSLMPGPSVLSLPVVFHGPVQVPSELAASTDLHLSWYGAPLRVRVLTPSS
ncbi:chemotaxis protein CheX [Nocardioides pantholopis]|uniref:chemotaxis protein CheX n=1 Tax=Nocardioides pantholopis TaxID=2483798 RepID=UPI000FD9E07E|nr:chemotaxis protein CheX [Nocardioides pantholopis]